MMMKKLLLILFFVGLTTNGFSQYFNSRNPSLSYCKLMGYPIELNEKDISYDVVLPDGDKVDSWAFFRGEAGKEYSYCAKKGYELKIKTIKTENASYNFPFCYKKNKENKEKDEKYLLKLIWEEGDYSKFDPGSKRTNPPEIAINPIIERRPPGDGYQFTFDWRNIDGTNYISDLVLEQSWDDWECGSCYAFSVCAVAEGVYNIATNNIDRKDFSESSIAFCGMCCYPGHILGCRGTAFAEDWYYPLLMATEKGMMLEENFPYFPDDQPCEPDQWIGPIFHFSGWGSVSGEVEAMKAALHNGPLTAAVYRDELFNNYCPEPDIPGDIQVLDSVFQCGSWGQYTPHSVAIVGYIEGLSSGGTTWIIRNSWGSHWGYEGYGYIKAGSHGISCQVGYLEYSVPGIYGPDKVCGSTNPYELRYLPPSHDAVTWELIMDDVTIDSGYGANINVEEPFSPTSDWATLQYIVTYIASSCQPEYADTFNKTIWVGKPQTPVIVGPDEVPCGNVLSYFEISYDTRYDGVDDYHWEVDGEGLYISGYHGNYWCYIGGLEQGNWEIKVRTSSNACGFSDPYIKIVSVECWPEPLNVYPNPASTSLTAELNFTEEVNCDFEFEIFTKDLQKKKNKTIRNNSLTNSEKVVFYVSDLPTGIYILKVKHKLKNNKIKEYTKQFIISR